jgi:ankyrin repeat protein
MSENANRQSRPCAIADHASLRNAAFRGQAERTMELITAGASVNEPDSDGDTPLMLAAAQGHTDIVTVLLRKGADANAHNDQGETALHQAAHGGHLGAVGALLAAGARVDTRDNGGSTPLMCATFGGHAEVTIALLDSGADVEIENFHGYGALDLAARKGLDLRGMLLQLDQRAETAPKGPHQRQASRNRARIGSLR